MKRLAALTISGLAIATTLAAPASAQINSDSLGTGSDYKTSPTCAIPGSTQIGSVVALAHGIVDTGATVASAGPIIELIDKPLVHPFSWDLIGMIFCTDVDGNLPGSSA